MKAIPVSMIRVLAVSMAVGSFACGPTDEPPTDAKSAVSSLTDQVAVGETLVTTTDAPLRKAANKSAGVLATVPASTEVEALRSSPKNGFYKVRYEGLIGWIRGSALARVEDSSTTAGAGGATTTGSTSTGDSSSATTGASSGSGSMSDPSASYFVATNGSDDNDGSLSSPFRTLAKANSVAAPGQLIRIRGGVYSEFVKLTTSGESGSPIVYEATPGEQVIFDGSSIPPATEAQDPWNQVPQVFEITGAFVTLRGIEVRNAPWSSVAVWETHDVVVENIHAHDGFGTGINMWRSSGVRVAGCEVHAMYDYGPSEGNNADCINENSSENNIIEDNLLYECSDDGIDTWDSPGNIVQRNVAHHMGKGVQGNGNGFKLGGTPGSGHNIVRFNVAYQNHMRGFDTNGGEENVIYNNTAFDNDAVGFENTDGLPNTYWNNISDPPNVDMAGDSNDDHNNWNLGISNPGFASTDPNQSSFLHLASDSACIDRGRVIDGIPFTGSAPDLGAFPDE